MSLVVMGLSLRSSVAGPSHAVVAGSVPVGIVTGAGPAAAPAPTATRRARRSASAAPAPSATRAAVRAAVHKHKHPSPPAPAPAAPSPTPASNTTYTVTGPAVESGYGPVQVQLKIRGHQIVAADAIEYPQGSSTDQQKNSYAIPQLDNETLQAQSAQIDSVSGATYTSQAYISSLQSAIDQAHQGGIF